MPPSTATKSVYSRPPIRRDQPAAAAAGNPRGKKHQISQLSQRVSTTNVCLASAFSVGTQRVSQSTLLQSQSSFADSTVAGSVAYVTEAADNSQRVENTSLSSQLSSVNTVVAGAGGSDRRMLQPFQSDQRQPNQPTAREEAVVSDDDDDDTVVDMPVAQPGETADASGFGIDDSAEEPELCELMEDALTKFASLANSFQNFITDAGDDAVANWLEEQVKTDFVNITALPIDKSELEADLDVEQFISFSTSLKEFIFAARKPSAQNFTTFWTRLVEESEQQLQLGHIFAWFNVLIYNALQIEGSSEKEKRIGLECATCYVLLVGISSHVSSERLRQRWKLDNIAYEAILNNCCQLAKVYKPLPRLKITGAPNESSGRGGAARNNMDTDADDDAAAAQDNDLQHTLAALADQALTLYVCMLKMLDMYQPRVLAANQQPASNQLLRAGLRVIEIFLRILPPPSPADRCAVARKVEPPADQTFERAVISTADAVQNERLYVASLTAVAKVLYNSVKFTRAACSAASSNNRQQNSSSMLQWHALQDLKTKITLVVLQLMPLVTLLDENRKSYGAKLTALTRRRAECVAAFLLSIMHAHYADLDEFDRRQNGLHIKLPTTSNGVVAGGKKSSSSQQKMSGRRMFLHVMMQLVQCSPDNRDARIHINTTVMNFWRRLPTPDEKLAVLIAYQQLACHKEVSARCAALEFATMLWREPLLQVPSTLQTTGRLPFTTSYGFAKAIICSGLQSPSINLRSFALTCFKSLIMEACKPPTSSEAGGDVQQTRRNAQIAAIQFGFDSLTTAKDPEFCSIPSLRYIFNNNLIQRINDDNGRVRRAVLALVADVALIEPSIITPQLLEMLRERFRDPSVAVRRQVVATLELLLRNSLTTPTAAAAAAAAVATSSSTSNSVVINMLANLYLETVVKVLFDSDQPTRELAAGGISAFILEPLCQFAGIIKKQPANNSSNNIASLWSTSAISTIGGGGIASAEMQLAWRMCGIVARDASGDMLRCLEEAVEEWSKDKHKSKQVDQFNGLLLNIATSLASSANSSADQNTASRQAVTVWCLLSMMSRYDEPNTLKCEIGLEFLFKLHGGEPSLPSNGAEPSISSLLLGYVLQFIIHKARSMPNKRAEQFRDDLMRQFDNIVGSSGGHICSAIRCMRALCEAATAAVSTKSKSTLKAEKINDNNSMQLTKLTVDPKFLQWARSQVQKSFANLKTWLLTSLPTTAATSAASPNKAAVTVGDATFAVPSPTRGGGKQRSVIGSNSANNAASSTIPTVERVVRDIRALAEFSAHSIDMFRQRDGGNNRELIIEILAFMCRFESNQEQQQQQSRQQSRMSTQQQQSQKQQGGMLRSRLTGTFKLAKLSSQQQLHAVSWVQTLSPQQLVECETKVEKFYEIRVNALVALGRFCLLTKDSVLLYAPKFVAMLLDANADDGLRCTCLQVLMDLLKRHPDYVERYLPRMTQCIGETSASTRLRETAVQNLQRMLQTDHLRYDGQFIFEVLAALPEADKVRRRQQAALMQQASSQQTSSTSQQSSQQQQPVSEQELTNRMFAKNVETILTTLSDNDPQKWLNIFLRAVLFFNGYTHHSKFEDALRAEAANNKPGQPPYEFKLAGQAHRRRRRVILQFMLLKMRDWPKLMLIGRVMEELAVPAFNNELVFDENLISSLIDIFELMSSEKNMRIAALEKQNTANNQAGAGGVEGDAALGDVAGGGNDAAAAAAAEIAEAEQASARKLDEEKLRSTIESTLRELSLHRVVPALAALNSMARSKGYTKLHDAIMKYTKFVTESPIMCCKPEDFDEALLVTPNLDRDHIMSFRKDLHKYKRNVALRQANNNNNRAAARGDGGDDADDSEFDSGDESAAAAVPSTAPVSSSGGSGGAEQLPASQASSRVPSDQATQLPATPTEKTATAAQQTQQHSAKKADVMRAHMEQRRRTRTELAELSRHERSMMGGASIRVAAKTTTTSTATPIKELASKSPKTSSTKSPSKTTIIQSPAIAPNIQGEEPTTQEEEREKVAESPKNKRNSTSVIDDDDESGGGGSSPNVTVKRVMTRRAAGAPADTTSNKKLKAVVAAAEPSFANATVSSTRKRVNGTATRAKDSHAVIDDEDADDTTSQRTIVSRPPAVVAAAASSRAERQPRKNSTISTDRNSGDATTVASDATIRLTRRAARHQNSNTVIVKKTAAEPPPPQIIKNNQSSTGKKKPPPPLLMVPSNSTTSSRRRREPSDAAAAAIVSSSGDELLNARAVSTPKRLASSPSVENAAGVVAADGVSKRRRRAAAAQNAADFTFNADISSIKCPTQPRRRAY